MQWSLFRGFKGQINHIMSMIKSLFFLIIKISTKKKTLPNEFSSSIYAIKLHPQLLFFVTITRRISYSYQFFDTNFKNVQFFETFLRPLLVSRKKTHFFVVLMILFWSQTLIFGQKWLKMRYQFDLSFLYLIGNFFFSF